MLIKGRSYKLKLSDRCSKNGSYCLKTIRLTRKYFTASLTKIMTTSLVLKTSYAAFQSTSRLSLTNISYKSKVGRPKLLVAKILNLIHSMVRAQSLFHRWIASKRGRSEKFSRSWKSSDARSSFNQMPPYWHKVQCEANLKRQSQPTKYWTTLRHTKTKMLEHSSHLKSRCRRIKSRKLLSEALFKRLRTSLKRRNFLRELQKARHTKIRTNSSLKSHLSNPSRNSDSKSSNFSKNLSLIWLWPSARQSWPQTDRVFWYIESQDVIFTN